MLRPDEEDSGMDKVLSLLQSSRHEALRFILKFLHEVSLHEESNKMSSKNLATVFAPSMYSSGLTATPQDYLSKLPKMISFLQFLIEQGNKVDENEVEGADFN